MTCADSACAGTVVDGYCNVCGMAPRRDTAGTATTGSRSRAGSTRTTARLRIGAGLVDIAPVGRRDPAGAVMDSPAVGEHRRFCARCDEPVGRGLDGVPGRAEGFCRRCGAPFSFVPKLNAGDLVAGQYEIAGCLAHGGLGWIYLARDRNVSDRWVVLKGLLDSNDPDAMAAALAERSFLAEVEHPNIVKIFNFVEHDGSGYIVMEYVDGTSLRDLLKARRAAGGGALDPLPVAEAIAYMLEILPALGHLHERGLLFCDFKPDNVIQTDQGLKLIDLGGVYRADDESSPIYGTVGFQAPEVAETGPTVASDLFTVARTLAVLCTNFRGYQTTHQHTLPLQESVALYTRYDSLYRLLEKATAADPRKRFLSAEALSDQLLGVLREVVAAEQGKTITAQSTLFTADPHARIDRVGWRSLPAPRVSAGDAAASYLAIVTAPDAHGRLDLLRKAPERTVEVEFQTVRELIETGDRAAAGRLLDKLRGRVHRDWRINWYRGVSKLAGDRAAEAERHFEAVYRAVPGELAPRLALGITAELTGAPSALHWYEVVSRTDPWYTTATFGLARCALAAGDRERGLRAYDHVPAGSSAHAQAQVAKLECLLEVEDGAAPDLATLKAAGALLESLEVGGEERARLTVDLLLGALALVESDVDIREPVRLVGHDLTADTLRFGLERTYRLLGRFATTAEERIRWVDWANRVRPRTWT
ncbi:MAG TPA: tetratricopeptide repeat protein [Solirubrobacteraceae bacterium]|nr:tetratricopeptide repeat protein [Solirubrobacteraceae bacterium]